MNYLVKSVTVTSLAVLLSACSSKPEPIGPSYLSDPISVDSRNAADVHHFQGKIPSDHLIYDILFQDNSTWQDLDEFFRTALVTDAGKHYYDNLEWFALAQIINHPGFVTEASLSTKQYYVEKLNHRDFINEPSVAVMLLQNLSTTDLSLDVAELAREAIAINQRHFSSEDKFSTHQENHSSAYTELIQMGFNRWGEEL